MVPVVKHDSRFHKIFQVFKSTFNFTYSAGSGGGGGGRGPFGNFLSTLSGAGVGSMLGNFLSSRNHQGGGGMGMGGMGYGGGEYQGKFFNFNIAFFACYRRWSLSGGTTTSCP